MICNYFLIIDLEKKSSAGNFKITLQVLWVESDWIY